MLKILPLLVIIFILIIGALNYLPLKRALISDTTVSCCKVADVEKSNGNFDESSNIAIFNNEIVDYPKTSLANDHSIKQNTAVLGTTNSNGEEKWIEVSLDQQMLRAWEGNKIVMEFAISSGKWARTPKGTFNIWYKTRSQKMEGGNKDIGTYYNLPNVPSNMFFHQGYAIHGAYWHNNFGTPMSHGCVNSPLDKVAQLFEWTGPHVPSDKNYVRASADNPGTKVYIH